MKLKPPAKKTSRLAVCYISTRQSKEFVAKVRAYSQKHDYPISAMVRDAIDMAFFRK